jgi:hypothetical protein
MTIELLKIDWQGWFGGLGKFEWQNLIAAISALVALFILVLGYRQYKSTERWKRAEFVSAQIKEFNADKINRAILLMMDYHPASVDLHPDKKLEERSVEVELDMLVKAIRDEDDLSDDEFQIEIFFEHFLRSLQRLNFLITAKAIDPKELQADFYYPIGLMWGYSWEIKHKHTEIDMRPFSNAVKEYLVRWRYPGVEQFCERIRTGRR